MTTPEKIKQLESEEAELWTMLSNIEDGVRPLRHKWYEKFKQLSVLRAQESEGKNDNA